MSPPNTNDPHSPASSRSPSSSPPPPYARLVRETRPEANAAPLHPPSDLRAAQDAFQHALEVYHHGNGDVLQAIPLFEEAAALHRMYMALVYLGDIFYYGSAKCSLKPDYALAFDYYTKATQHGLVLGIIGLGDCYLFNHGLPAADRHLSKTERLQRAKQHYEQALHNTSQPITRLLCGLADLEYYKRQGDVRTQLHVIPLSDDAVRKYQKANQLDPRYYRAKLGLADCILARGHRDRAVEIYMDIAESMPQLKRPYVGLALATQDPVERLAYVDEAEAADKSDY
ncbi:hypothetical protein GGF31_002408 [Allomyces arbusculus]|nr:hypothetical protein GGF31_002408 [Allomyces arbusculus]